MVGQRTQPAARKRSPDGTAAPPDGFDSWDGYMAAFEASEGRWRDREAQRGLKAMRLAPTLTVYEALLAGERVPREALDPAWARRYRL